jgi:hypothetical protein
MRPLLTAVAMSSVLAIGACEGENLFSVPGQGGRAGADARAPEVNITVPRGDTLSGAALMDSVLVSVHLKDGVGVRSVRLYGLSLRGDASLGTQQVVQRYAEKTVALPAGVKDTTLTRYLMSVGDTARGSSLVIVEASDSAGNMTADTASLAVGGPSVELPGFLEGATVSAGANLTATIRAADPRGVNRLGLEISGSVKAQVLKTLGTSALSAQLDTAIFLPDTASGTIFVTATGRNTLGVVERSPAFRLFVADQKPPVTTIIVPRGDSLSAKPLGDSVRMLGQATRGDKSLGTDTIIQRFVERAITLPAGVRDTTISRYLRATPDSTKETAQIMVIAADSAGNQSLASVNLILGGPDVRILDIVNGQSIQAGLGLSARILAKDPQGIIQVRVSITGAFDTTIVTPISPPRDSLVLDTVVAVPANAVGPLLITASARNSLDVAGQDGPLGMLVIPAGVGDTIRPVLKHGSTAPERMEIQDSITIEVTGTDLGGGVAQAGYTVLGISPTRGDTLIRADSASFSPPRTGTVTKFFKVGAFNVDSLALPDTLVYEVTTWLKDAQGNCSASVGLDSLVALPCATLPTGQIAAQGRTGQRVTRSVVAGKTVRLPVGGKIMDAAVDTMRRKLFLSNILQNQIEVFNLQTEKFGKAIGVGAEPWGLAFTRDQDSLWVANSLGTNLSVVNLDTEQEVDQDRFLTPDVLLFDVELKSGDAGVQYIIRPLPQPETPSFTDRPQYVAVDSFGNIIYSTKTSTIGDYGTARKGFFSPGWARSEAKLFVEHANFEPTEDFWALAHIDAISSTVDTLSVDSLGVATIAGVIQLIDHLPGFPDSIITGVARSSDGDAVNIAAAELISKGSDIFIAAGTKWNIQSMAFLDTTYVAASGDGGWVAVGEGGASPAGRVLAYQAKPTVQTGLSRWMQVANLLENPSEEVRGIGLNYDGTLGVVRGRFAAYFITPEDLILQGGTEIENSTLGSGATLHPLHANGSTVTRRGEYRPDTHLAFVASGNRTVDIIDTWRFKRVGRIYTRDIITGPLRAVLPFPEDNAGYACSTIPVTDKRGTPIGDAIRIYNGESFISPIAPDGITEDRCVVIKLFAPTSGGGVVVIDVRKADVLREHPERN